MKETYKDRYGSEEETPAMLSESASPIYAAVQHDTVSVAIHDENMLPCTYSDDEMYIMLEEIENERVFIPDSIVRKMFA